MQRVVSDRACSSANVLKHAGRLITLHFLPPCRREHAMFINNSESGLDKLFQFCRITLQHSGFVNLLPRIYGHVFKAGRERGGQGQKRKLASRPSEPWAVHAKSSESWLLAEVAANG